MLVTKSSMMRQVFPGVQCADAQSQQWPKMSRNMQWPQHELGDDLPSE